MMMLKKRVITGILLAVILLAATFMLNLQLFAILSLMITLYAGWEWAQLMGLSGWVQKTLYVGALFVSCLLGIFYLPPVVILYTACVLWIFMLYVTLRYPAQAHWFKSIWVSGVLGLAVLMPFWVSLLFLRALSGGVLLLWCIAIVITADASAYFIGKRFGKRQLAPNLSPGKTLEGVLGALVLTQIVGVGSAIGMGGAWSSLPTLVALIFMMTIFSIVGDLTESMMKRLAGVKDSGNILPGHGGVLDRIDGYTAALPMFVLALMLFLRGSLGV